MNFLTVVAFACIVAVSAVRPRFNPRFQRQEVVPHTIYGPPPQEPETPPQEYGPPPQETTTAAAEETTTALAEETTTAAQEEGTTTESQSELVNNTRTGRLTKNGERGVYYIYHPSGQLQKVAYSTKQDPRNRAYTAQVKYEDVDPIRAPIFTYDPKTLILSRLQP